MVSKSFKVSFTLDESDVAYFRKLYRFYEYTGFDLLEHDGSYPGDFDACARPPLCSRSCHPGTAVTDLDTSSLNTRSSTSSAPETSTATNAPPGIHSLAGGISSAAETWSVETAARSRATPIDRSSCIVELPVQ